ncbi:phosphoglycolate phosphatase [Candidatus Bathyarchaeota archaeon]|nr:phosphoglycolate phosphatase [Candidatus Bathyarchaeota archaeon]
MIEVNAIACDYDRTLTNEKLEVSKQAIQTLKMAKMRKKVKVIIVSGRMLGFLIKMNERFQVADALVAENGAVIFLPNVGTKLVLGERSGQRLRDAFKLLDIPHEMGDVIVSTKRTYETIVLKIINETMLNVNIEYNRDSLMILPPGIDKGKGVLRALLLLGVPRGGLACIGDAENDVALFKIADVSVAVANAVDSLKRQADIICDSPHGNGVMEFVKNYVLT